MERAQDVFEQIGRFGCYFLCLIRADELQPDEIVRYYHESVKRGFMQPNCFVVNPVQIANLRSGQKYVSVTVADKPSPTARRIFAHVEGKHFIEVDPSGKIVYNPLSTFKCEGRVIRSYRLLS